MEIRDEEQDSFDNLPEGLQESIRGETMQEAIYSIEEWCDEIDIVRDQIEVYASK